MKNTLTQWCRPFLCPIQSLFLLLILGFSLFPSLVTAQNNCEIPYEFVLRDADQKVLVNDSVDLRVTILDDLGNSLFSESHLGLETSLYGTASLTISTGALLSGDYSTIPWTTNEVFIQTEVDIEQNGNFLDFGNTKLTAHPCQYLSTENLSARGVVELNNANHETIVIENNDIINVRDTVTIPQYYYVMQNASNLVVSGGKFKGQDGYERMYLGNANVFIGVEFENIKLQSSFGVIFINCRFSGSIQFPSGSIVKGGSMRNLISGATPYVSEAIIINSNVIIGHVSNCELINSIVSGVGDFVNNKVSECQISPYLRGIVSGNYFDRSYLVVGGDIRILTISDNIFDDASYTHGPRTELIKILIDEVGRGQINISSNHFDTSNLDQIILLSNTSVYTPFININNNTILGGKTDYGIKDNSSNAARLLVTNNMYEELNNGIGVSSQAGIRVVNNNYEF